LDVFIVIILAGFIKVYKIEGISLLGAFVNKACLFPNAVVDMHCDCLSMLLLLSNWGSKKPSEGDSNDIIQASL